MQISGQVRKLTNQIDTQTRLVHYHLPIGDEQLPLNELIGQHLEIQFSEAINCINCGRKTKKSFAQGHCFPCMRSLASCDTCIMKPELCHFHKGTCREPEWGEKNCFADHFVYLSNTSGLKIGITRGNQIPTRWVDQGAVAAMPIYKVANRRISGLLEHPAAQIIADKTNWRTMLKGDIPHIDILSRWEALKPQLEEIAQKIRIEYGEQSIVFADHEVREFNYPVIEYPTKIASHNLDKAGQAAGKLIGIKGQYLIFDTGVLNIRKYTGYDLTFSS